LTESGCGVFGFLNGRRLSCRRRRWGAGQV